MNSNKDFWQRTAWIYGFFAERGNRRCYKLLCREIERYLKKDMKVLELACGTGQLSTSLAVKVKEWEATDFSEKMVRLTQRRGIKGNIHFSVQDATKLPYENESFNTIVIANALHIMPEPDKALSEIHRVLRFGGILIAPTYVYEDGSSRWMIKLSEKAGFKTFHKWRASEYQDFVRNRGFKTKSVKIINSRMLSECLLIACKNN